MDWKAELIEALRPYGEPVETSGGVLFELVDEESGVYDRLAFYIENPPEERLLLLALVEALKDLTDHDLPGRNVFAFGFRPEFEGEVIRLSLVEGAGGVIIGRVPKRVIEIAERNGIPFIRGDGEGIGITEQHDESDFDALIKLVEAVAFEW